MSSGWLCEFIVISHVTGEQYWLSSLLTQRGRTVVLDRRPYREGALGKWSMTLLRGGMLNFITFTEMWFIYSATSYQTILNIVKTQNSLCSSHNVDLFNLISRTYKFELLYFQMVDQGSYSNILTPFVISRPKY